MVSSPLLLALIGFALGALLAWGIARLLARAERSTLAERLAAREREVSELRAARQAFELRAEREIAELRRVGADLRNRVTEVETTLDLERQTADEKLRLLEGAREQLGQAFSAASAEALAKNNEAFLHLAKQNLEVFQERARGDLEAREKAIGDLVRPLADSLGKVDEKIRELETTREKAYGGLAEQLRSVALTQQSLHVETSRLVQALRQPAARGRWGEIQLRRVVEMAGMIEYCDFEQQPVGGTLEDGRVRPDLIVRLPNEKNIVVDAKAPLESYLLAIETVDEEARRVHLMGHAAQVRAHLGKLSAKSYWSQFEPAPEFVVLFLPGETFFSAALEQDPSLIEAGVEQGVILATPTTLIALLRAVAYGWRQEQMTKNALEISKLGRVLHDRLRTLAGHFGTLAGGLERAIEAYNKAVGSLETRVMPAARKLKEYGATSGEEIEELVPIDRVPRALQTQLHFFPPEAAEADELDEGDER
ncbi:MAG TPA: DNA recombination protein RmuC [Thermoanaerobaculia bacterium]|jgi:DNA recombination protein RmuC|nr:DNA recombination protein RmuC [Thermoanaerobaculia bacterium]